MEAAARARVGVAVRMPLATALRLTLGFITVVGPAAPVAARDKSDSVTLKNGDRFTGEIKGVGQQALEIDTDAAGTVTIEWTHIASITSTFDYEVEVTTGGGSSVPSRSPTNRENSRLSVTTETRPSR